jgi:hypothetical protein
MWLANEGRKKQTLAKTAVLALKRAYRRGPTLQEIEKTANGDDTDSGMLGSRHNYRRHTKVNYKL